MSRKCKFRSQDDLYFISTATVNWIDVFTRSLYKDIVMESLRFCQREKDLDICAWCLMTNHLHLIIGTRGRKLEHTLRDMKQFTAKRILEAVAEHPEESRRDWMLWMMERAGSRTPGNDIYQLWQHDNHPIAVFTAPVLLQKLHYIHQNPVVAGFVERPEDWLYSSAKNYYSTDLPLLDVLLIE